MSYRCTKNITKRLKRVQGQVNGLIRMSEQGRPCEEILLQIKAANAALRKVAQILVSEHIENCIKEAILEGKGEEAVESLKETLDRYLDW